MARPYHLLRCFFALLLLHTTAVIAQSCIIPTDPPHFLCPAGQKCLNLAGDTTQLCCPEFVGECDKIQPITCNITLQDPLTVRGSRVATSLLDEGDNLPRCGSGCCPFGYLCDPEQQGVCRKQVDQENWRTNFELVPAAAEDGTPGGGAETTTSAAARETTAAEISDVASTTRAAPESPTPDSPDVPATTTSAPDSARTDTATSSSSSPDSNPSRSPPDSNASTSSKTQTLQTSTTSRSSQAPSSTTTPPAGETPAPDDKQGVPVGAIIAIVIGIPLLLLLIILLQALFHQHRALKSGIGSPHYRHHLIPPCFRRKDKWPPLTVLDGNEKSQRSFSWVRPKYELPASPRRSRYELSGTPRRSGVGVYELPG